MEFAILLPMLLLILFGIIDFGRAIQQQILITEAVREGARVGAVAGDATAVDTRVKSVLGSGFTYTYTPAPTVCTAGSTGGTASTVTISHKFDPATPVLGLMALFPGPSPTSITLTATGVMSCVG